MSKRFVRGVIEGSTIVIILLSIALIGMSIFGAWAYLNYQEAQSDIDSKIEIATSKAKKDEAEEQREKCAQREKEPNHTFNAPTDLGGVSFLYPKTWSAYVDNDGTDGKDYFAYLHPSVVPQTPKNTKTQQRYALRVAIYNATMEEVLKEYEKTIEKGELSSAAAIANGKNATKLEGLFPSSDKNNRIKGVAYFFKINDKVLMMKSDADTFRKEFNDLINTIKF